MCIRESLTIVYTPLHGSGNVPVRRILREIGITNVSVVKEQEAPDPNFSTVRVPNPEAVSYTHLPLEARAIEYQALRGTTDGMDLTAVSEIAEYMEREIGLEISPRQPFA